MHDIHYRTQHSSPVRATNAVMYPARLQGLVEHEAAARVFWGFHASFLGVTLTGSLIRHSSSPHD